eukprot:9492606-Pyramimonas_sp.AAC.1
MYDAIADARPFYDFYDNPYSSANFFLPKRVRHPNLRSAPSTPSPHPPSTPLLHPLHPFYLYTPRPRTPQPRHRSATTPPLAGGCRALSRQRSTWRGSKRGST